MTDKRPVALLTVHSCPFSDIGGAENGGMSVYIREVNRALTAQGVPTVIFTRREDAGAPHEVDLPEGSRLVHINAGPEKPLDKNSVFYHLPEFLDGVAAYARDEGVEFRVIHSHYWLSGWVGKRLGELWGVPWLHTAHTLGRVKDRDRPPGAASEPVLRVAVEDEIVRDCNRLVVHTAQEREDMAVLYGSGRDCVAIVPPGVDLAVFKPVPHQALSRELGILPGEKVVLFTGRLERLKGLETLIFAVASLLQSGFPGIRLVVLGDDSSSGRLEAGSFAGERARLEALCAEIGIDDRVSFLGRVPHDQLPGYYSLADVVAVPSYSESFGLVALEAQACHTPVVASRVGGLRQLVLDGITGYTVARHDPQDYAGALGRILSDDQLRSVMGVAAGRLARAYSWDATARRLLDVYAETQSDYLRAAEAVFG